MERDFPFALVTPTGTVLEGRVNRVTLRDQSGSFSVLAGHAPLVASLPEQEGETETADGRCVRFFIRDGLAEVSSQGLTVLASEASIL